MNRNSNTYSPRGRITAARCTIPTTHCSLSATRRYRRTFRSRRSMPSTAVRLPMRNLHCTAMNSARRRSWAKASQIRKFHTQTLAPSNSTIFRRARTTSRRPKLRRGTLRTTRFTRRSSETARQTSRRCRRDEKKNPSRATV